MVKIYLPPRSSPSRIIPSPPLPLSSMMEGLQGGGWYSPGRPKGDRASP